MSEMTREQALEHFGVKGMHWGTRKANPGPIGRTARKVATYQTQDMIESHKKALEGRGIEGFLAKADKYTWGGGGRFEGYHNKKISELERSVERIAKGELVATTILFGPQYTKEKKK
jgi:hypothetical protein